MKKTFKRLFAAVSACAMCAVPLTGNFSVSAASSEQYNTYVIYYDTTKLGVAEFELSFSYDSDVVAEPCMKTSLCNGGNFNSTIYAVSRKVITTYKGSAINQKGTVATSKLLIPLNVNEGIFDKISCENNVVKNAAGSNMTPSSVSIDAVLLGDSNGDGKIDMSDAVLIQQYIANPTKYPIEDLRAADVDGDGEITDNDSLMIQRFKADIIQHF